MSIILALDTKDLRQAREWIKATNAHIKYYKAGLEFFLTHGYEGIKALEEVGEFQLFLDLKLHDIPNTVAQAVTAVAKIEPRFLTVHAGGGSKMIAAAAMAAPEIDITAVTVLTSLSADDLAELGISASPLAQAVKLAELSVAAGAKAIVCSPLEVAAIRTAVGASPIIITPGVRPAGDSLGDQVRVMTPKDAIAAGSSLLVIGRPITSLESSAAMTAKAAAILEEIHG